MAIEFEALQSLPTNPRESDDEEQAGQKGIYTGVRSPKLDDNLSKTVGTPNRRDSSRVINDESVTTADIFFLWGDG